MLNVSLQPLSEQGWRYLRVLLFFMTGLLGLIAHSSAETVVLQPSMDRQIAAPWMRVLEDPSAELALEDILQPERLEQFQPLPNGRTAFGVSRSAWWVQLQVTNPRAIEQHWLLEAIHNLTDHVDLYQVRDNDVIRYLKQGDHLGPDAQLVPSEAITFPLVTAPGESDQIFLRFSYADAGIFNLYLELSTWSEYRESQHANGILLGVFLGASLLVMLYTFFMAWSTRDAPYFWYLLYAMVATLLYLSLSGMGYRYLWGQSVWWSDMLPNLAVGFFYLLGIQFTRSFLATAQQVPRIDRLLQLLWLVTAIAVVLLFVGATVIAVDLLLNIGLILALFPLLGGWLWYRGDRIARGYTVAWCVWSLTVVSGVLRFKGVIPTGPMEINIARFGVISQMVLLSLALADRINIVRIARLAAEQHERKATEQAMAELESSVSKRTSALEIARQRAEKQAREDALSGLLNRRAFFEQGREALLEAGRTGLPLSVMILDIDHFKSINDNHGHATGDEVIRAIANTLTATLRELDVKARIGGEEFAVALPKVPAYRAEELADRVRLRINTSSVETGDGEISVTASIGVATLQPGDDSLEALLQRADEALYRAKQAGRDRVVAAESAG